MISPGVPAPEFALTKLRTSPGAPAFVFHPAPSGWNLLWKREDFTRGPRTSECNEEVWGGFVGWVVWGGFLGWVCRGGYSPLNLGGLSSQNVLLFLTM